MPSHLILHHLILHKIQEAEGQRELSVRQRLYTVTLAFDWLRTVCKPCFPEKATLAFSSWATTYRSSNSSFTYLTVKPRDISEWSFVGRGRSLE